MTEPLVVAVDCSTTAAKAVILDRSGRVVASASRPLALNRPHPSWHEQDAEEWWTATLGSVAQAVAALDDPGQVRAMCLTHQRESFVCLDDGGRPLRPAILWLDGRAHAEIAELGSPRVHELSGKPPDTTPALYKLAWLARHEPSVLRTATRVGDVQAFLSLRLTGEWATSPASADTLGLFDARRQTWAPELLEMAGVRAEQLPDLVPAGELLGTIGAGVAATLGLPGPVPLVAGVGDGQAAGLALGSRSDVAYLNLGTSMVLGVQSEEYLWDPAFRTLAGVAPGRYTLETVLNAAAYLAGWFRTELGTDDDVVPRGSDGSGPDARGADALETAAAALTPGAEGLLTLPYWNAAQTPYWDPLARGAVVGWHGRHTRAHAYRSILEGVGFELRLHLERLEAATGRGIRSIRMVGGGARSPLWVRIIADITQRPVRVCADREVSAAGAALLAWAFLDSAGTRGPRGDGAAAVAAAAGVGEPVGVDILPDPAAASAYGTLFAVHGRLYGRLRETFAELAAVDASVRSSEPPG